MVCPCVWERLRWYDVEHGGGRELPPIRIIRRMRGHADPSRAGRRLHSRVGFSEQHCCELYGARLAGCRTVSSVCDAGRGCESS